MRSRQALIALTIVVPLFAASQGSAQTQSPEIGDGAVVHLEYILTDDGGKVIESNKGKDPLVYTQGRGQIIHGLEKALLGMHEGETKHVTVPPEEAYGAKDPQAIIELRTACHRTWSWGPSSRGEIRMASPSTRW